MTPTEPALLKTPAVNSVGLNTTFSIRLADLLQFIFALHRARFTCLAALVIAVFRVKTVNLAQLATAFPGPADIDSYYRRLQRFFKDVQLQPARMKSMSPKT